MPELIEFPVHGPADWAVLKLHFDPTDPARFPADWTEEVAFWWHDANHQSRFAAKMPLSLEGGSIAAMDHAIPSDVRYADFRYFRGANGAGWAFDNTPAFD